MSAHASQTSSGIAPSFIRMPKALHPRQRPRADSRKAATASEPTTIQVAVDSPNPNQRMRAVDEKATPTAWANRLGGPATKRAHRADEARSLGWRTDRAD